MPTTRNMTKAASDVGPTDDTGSSDSDKDVFAVTAYTVQSAEPTTDVMEGVEETSKRSMKRTREAQSSCSEEENASKKPATDALDSAMTAMEVVSNVMRELTETFSENKGLRELMKMILTALVQVSNALTGLRLEKEKSAVIIKENATTNTEARKGKKKGKAKSKLDARTPNSNTRPQKSQSVDLKPLTPPQNGTSETVNVTRPGAGNVGADQSETNEGPKTETWSTVVRKAPLQRTIEQDSGRGKPTPKKLGQIRPKPMAVLVKVAEGSTYADTVKLVKASGVDVRSLGAPIKDLRKTRSGDLIIELGRGEKAVQAADSLRAQLSNKLGEQTGPVTRLSSTTEAEIVGIDATADKEEVLKAVIEAVTGDGAAAAAEKAEISITGLWAVRSGHQVATLRVPVSVLRRVQKINVGWTRCTLRARRPEPPRCFRCHGFGHTARTCDGPDVGSTCRRCGSAGHQEKACEAGNDRCVACERAGHKKVEHRPGSGACAAKRAALMTGNSPR